MQLNKLKNNKYILLNIIAMALKLLNINLDKDEYIYWEDKEINVKFDVISDEKSFKLNSIIIKYGVIIYLSWKKFLNETESKLLVENVNISWISQNFQFTIPIKYPNIWDKQLVEFFDEEKKEDEYEGEVEDNFESYIFNSDINLKNYIEIVVDKWFSLFDCKKEIYPKVYSEFDINTNHLTLKDDLFNSEDYKNNIDYINIWFDVKKKEYISKDFYNHLNNNYKSFRYFDFIRNNFKYLVSTYIVMALIFISFLFLSEKLIISKSFFNNFGLIFFGINIIGFILYVYIKRGIRTIKDTVINIKFKDKKNIKQSLKDKDNISIKDIYEEIWINYDWKYNCKINLYMSSILRLTNKEKTGKNSKFVEYNKTINLYELWNYEWRNLSLKKIINFQSDKKNNIIPIKDFWKTSMLKFWYWSAKIIYKFFYKFESSELIGKYWEIVIGWDKDNFSKFLNKLIWN